MSIDNSTPSLLKRRLILVFAGVVLLLVTLLLALQMSLYQPIDNISDTLVYEVSPGSSLTRVSAELEDLGITNSALLFRVFAQWQGQADAIQAGEYGIRPGMSAADVLNLLVSGDSLQHRLTLVEGWTLREALTAIASIESIDHTLEGLSNSEIAMELAIPYDNPEGLFHPDTYFFTRNTSDAEILARARARQLEILNDAWSNRLGALPYASEYEALIMASIIEKESGIASERGHIAGVFVRRLEQGMRLQSDPTVIYGIGDAYDGDITREHLRTTTAYNTYRINGLPPTPIALPGEASIRAALNPVESDYLYFVATGNGGHYFSSSLEEHNEAVQRYQLRNSQAEDL